VYPESTNIKIPVKRSISQILAQSQKIYGCKVFSAASREEFFKWLSDLKANKTPEHGCF